MAITKSTSASYITSNGAFYPTLADAKYREMADIFLSMFATAGIPTSNNLAIGGARILGKYFVDVSGATLTSINQSITTCRGANP